MESYGIMNKIEFNGIKSVYPCEEELVCQFALPVAQKPECGDWIGIFPVGWSSIREVVCKKPLGLHHMVGRNGRIEFEVEVLPKGEQYYQFVYVKNGEYVKGTSTPFALLPREIMSGLRYEEMINKPESTIFGGKYMPYTSVYQGEQKWSSIPSQWGVPSKSTIGNGVEQIFGQVQTGLVGLEQTLKGLKTFNGEELISSWCPEGIFATKPICGEYKWWTQITEPQQIKKYWSQKVNEIESVLREQIKIEYAHRKLEQLNILTQLKSFERHIMNVQKREQEIKEFLRCKMQRQIREFEQKVYNVMKLNVELNGQQQQQPEYYVKKYEQLLREKIQLDQENRQIILNKFRQSIKECERKLREIQSVEIHFFNRFHQQLRNKIAQEFESKHIKSIILGGEFSEKIDLHLREQLKNVIVQFFFEQKKEQLHFIKMHKQLVNLVCEMACKLQELECEAYTHLRIPRISTVYPIESHPSYTQVKSLEQQIFDLKTLLRSKIVNNVNIPSFLTCGEWIRPIVQKLRELEWNLRQEKINFEQYQHQQQQQQLNGELSSSVRGLWFERRLEKLAKQMKFFEQHMEVRQLEEVRLREIFVQLKDLECELYELPQFFEQYYNKFSAPMMMTSMIKSLNGQKQQQQQIVELCLFLQQIVKEKIQHLETSIPSIKSVLSGLYNGEYLNLNQFPTTFTPVELFLQSGNQYHQIWKQLLAHERKVVELKGLFVERQHYKQLKERLVDLEQLIREVTVVKRQEKYLEQIESIKSMLETRFAGLGLIGGQQQSFATSVFVPELYQTVVQKYEKLYQLINELESQLIEKRSFVSSVYPRQSSVVEFEPSFESFDRLKQLVNFFVQTTPMTMTEKYQQQQQQTSSTTLNFIHQKFEKLVQEFLRQLPRHIEVEYMPRCEQIVSFLKSVQLATSEYKYGLNNKQFLSKELKEKMCEFERILCELLESEKMFSSWTWTISMPSSTIVPSVYMTSPREYVRYLVKLVRELRGQIQNVLVDGEWELVEDLNNNGIYEPIEVLSGHEGILADLVEKYTQFYTRPTTHKQQQQQQQKETTITREITTPFNTTKTTTTIFDDEYVTPKMSSYVVPKMMKQLEREIENIEFTPSTLTTTTYTTTTTPSDLICFGGNTQREMTLKDYVPTILRSTNVENLLGELESELAKLRLQKEFPIVQSKFLSSYLPTEIIGEEIINNKPTTIVRIDQDNGVCSIEKQIQTVIGEQPISCPVCSVMIGKETTEVELHINGHFSF